MEIALKFSILVFNTLRKQVVEQASIKERNRQSIYLVVRLERMETRESVEADHLIIDGKVISDEVARKIVPERIARQIVGRANAGKRKRFGGGGNWHNPRKKSACNCSGCRAKRKAAANGGAK